MYLEKVSICEKNVYKRFSWNLFDSVIVNWIHYFKKKFQFNLYYKYYESFWTESQNIYSVKQNFYVMENVWTQIRSKGT